MSGTAKWEKKKGDCDESGRENDLLVEWRETEDGKKELGGVSCDDPKLTDYDGEECDWTCVDEIEGGKKPGGKGKDAKK